MNWFELTNLLTRPIAFHRIFATIGGGACAGIFLSQAFYWTPRTKDPDGWFYKSQVEWEEETALTRYEQEKIRRDLKSRGLIEEKKEGLPCKLFFRINKEALMQALGGEFKQLSLEEILNNHKSVLSQLSQLGVARAKKLGIEHEYVDYGTVLKTVGNSCHICNKPITQGVGQSGGSMCFDHVIPLSKGGSHTASNLKPAHANCNLIKADKLPNPCCDQFVVPQQTSVLSHNELACCPTTDKDVAPQQTYLYTETTPEITHTRGVGERNFGFGISGGSTDILIAPSSIEETKSGESQIVLVDQSSAAVPISPTTKYLPTKEEEALNFGRTRMPLKGTYKSRSHDPWMRDGDNPIPELVQWLFNKQKNDQKNLKDGYRNFTPSIPNAHSEICNNHVRARVLWQEFCTEIKNRVQIHNTRVAAGIPIAPEEVEEVKAIAPYSGIEVKAPSLLLQAAPEANCEVKPLPAPPSTTNASAYKEFVAPAPLKEEDVADFRANFSELAKSFGISKPKAKFNEINPYSSTIEQMRLWVSGDDSVLRGEAISWANKNAQNLEIDYDESGNIIDFTELSF